MISEITAPIVNDNFETALIDLVTIFNAQRLKMQNQKQKYEKLLRSFEWMRGNTLV